MTLEGKNQSGQPPGKTDPEETPIIPLRMVNEYVYCPRLCFLEWVQGEFAHNAYTVDGVFKHKRVDRPGGKFEPASEGTEKIHSRSVQIGSEQLGIRAKIDLVEGEERVLFPIDYKRGKRPHVPKGAYQPERIQVCAQGMLLREHGFVSDLGYIYFVGSRERVVVEFDDVLVQETLAAISGARGLATLDSMPPVLEDSPKCPHCSLVGICMPDEINFLVNKKEKPRPIIPSLENGLPFYVQSPHAYIRKSGGRMIVEEKGVKLAEVRFKDTSQVVVFGNTMVSTPVLHECFRRQIPLTYLSYGGWFLGHTMGSGHKNVTIRSSQFRGSFDDRIRLRLAKGWVEAKIRNCRTLLRRNRREDENGGVPERFWVESKEDMKNALQVETPGSLLGIEGAAASRYFRWFRKMLKQDDEKKMPFDFTGRNRRPPRDPVNAMLSFGYAMLVREWTVTLSAVGFDPYQGFFHRPRFGRPALSLDMMEPFRPLVADSAVITAINNGEVQQDDFIYSAGACNLNKNGRKKFIAVFERRMEQEITHPIFGYRISYRRLFEVQARLLARFLCGEISEYPNFVTR